MSRVLDAETVTMIASQTVRIEYLWQGVFSETTLRLWTGFGPLSWNGFTWEGNGWLQGHSSVRESKGDFAVILTGVPTELISLALHETTSTGEGTLYLAFFDSDEELIEVIDYYEGELGEVLIDEDARRPAILFNHNESGRDINENRESRLTHADQRVEFPNDRGLEYLTFLQQQRIYWGRPDPERGGRQ